ncbi:MAG: PaaI family thioesterase, partial [Bacteroidales bacterium]|nr:PaaI family thioesterase [Bacteroidales bacterium]
SQLTAILQITPNHLQPAGLVHGGVYISMAETIAGAGSTLLLKDEEKTAIGVTVNSQHLASVSKGTIRAEGELIYKGSFKHIWDIKITDQNGKLISISRVTNTIKLNNSQHQNSRK